RADVDDVDVLARDQLAPVGLDRFISPRVSEGFRLVGAAGANGLEDGAIGQIEEVIDLGVGVGVRPAHEAVTDHAEVQRFGQWGGSFDALRFTFRARSVPKDAASAKRKPDRFYLEFFFTSKCRFTSSATRAHSMFPALSDAQRLSSFSAVSTHTATGPL